MNNSRFIPWFVKEAFFVFVQFIAPVVVIMSLLGGMWLWVGKLYHDAGVDRLAPTPYGDMMRELWGEEFDEKAGVRGAQVPAQLGIKN